MIKSAHKACLLGLALATGLSACSNGRVSMQGGKPDEYAVVARSGLVVPEPGTGLAQPLPAGTDFKDKTAARDLAKRAVLGDADLSVAPATLDNRFGAYADIDIAKRIDQEASDNQAGRLSENFIQKNLSAIRVGSSNIDGTPLSLQEEVSILRSKGVSLGGGDFAVTGHSLDLISLGEPKYFDPRDIIRGL